MFGGNKAPKVEEKIALDSLRDPRQNTLTRMVRQNELKNN